MLHNSYEMLYYLRMRVTFKYLFLLFAEISDPEVFHHLGGISSSKNTYIIIWLTMDLDLEMCCLIL
jgi:hypothetical protein